VRRVMPCAFFGLRFHKSGNIGETRKKHAKAKRRKLLNLNAHVFTTAKNKFPFFKFENS
jgi:hypothetical protein